MKIDYITGWPRADITQKATSRRATRAMDAACKLFFAKRGLGELCDWRSQKHAEIQGVLARRKQAQ